MKEIITQMITEYLPVILTAVMTAIVGFVKSKYTKIANDSIKKDVASTTVKYIEQIYKDVHGTEKLEKRDPAAPIPIPKKYPTPAEACSSSSAADPARSRTAHPHSQKV